jgi:hypothetical protein
MFALTFVAEVPMFPLTFATMAHLPSLSLHGPKSRHHAQRFRAGFSVLEPMLALSIVFVKRRMPEKNNRGSGGI